MNVRVPRSLQTSKSRETSSLESSNGQMLANITIKDWQRSKDRVRSLLKTQMERKVLLIWKWSNWTNKLKKRRRENLKKLAL